MRMMTVQFVPKFHDWHVVAKVLVVTALAVNFWRIAKSPYEGLFWRVFGYIAIPILVVISIMYLGVFFGWWQ